MVSSGGQNGCGILRSDGFFLSQAGWIAPISWSTNLILQLHLDAWIQEIVLLQRVACPVHMQVILTPNLH
jgi:hypothetical protein